MGVGNRKREAEVGALCRLQFELYSFGLVNTCQQETLSCHLVHGLLLSASSVEDTELPIGSLRNVLNPSKSRCFEAPYLIQAWTFLQLTFR